MNPGGSQKDRIAVRMVADAERDGRLRPGATIVEPSSGNTGIALAMVAAVRGYKLIVCMPDRMSAEKSTIMQALGARIVRTPSGVPYDSPESHFEMARKICDQIDNAVLLDQYGNSSNPNAHYDTTAREILDQTDRRLDMIVVGVGTGGSITGIARRVKQVLPDCQIVGVDPYGSMVAEPDELNRTSVTGYEIEGIGHDFVTDVLDRRLVDQWYKSDDRSSMEMSRRLIAAEGLLCGGSSGAVVSAAMSVAKQLDSDQRCVCLLADGVANYMTKFMDNQWMRDRNYSVVSAGITTDL
ncbi:cystathionine beta-synthase-like protein [Oppia nitens]|uniref:cystathionine beta-synthase-like protein n=1 Tax=Oppia nitens TaxID=1686743 RepID=UPI0023DA4B19|nr:cystathionine beta-synthase-like protein [Oppia nitens]